MNKRIVKVDLNIDGLRVVRISDATQHDKSTHFIGISFMDNVELAGYALQVYYLPPFPATIPFVDTFENLQSSMEIPIPDRVLERNGEVTVEFVLSKDKELLTINQNFSFEVIKTINGTSLTAYPEGTLKETIAQQIEKIKGLLADTDTKIEEYNNNATSKTEQYNNNSTEKFNSFNQNYDEKLKSFNQNHTQKTSAFNDNADSKLKTYNDNDVLKTQNYNNNAEEKKSAFNNNVTQVANKFTDYINNTLNTATTEMDRRATSSANAAGERANQEVKNQEELSVQAVTNEGTKQVELVKNKGTEEVEKIQAAVAQGVRDVNANKDAHVKAVTDEGNKQVLAVGNKGTEEVSKVQSAGAKAVEDVNANKTANIQAITEEGTKQTELVRTEGEKQIGLVVDKGAEQTTAIENKGTEEVEKVTSEGSKQTGLVNIEGNKVIEQVKNIIGQNPSDGNALTLGGKTRPEFEKELQGVAGGYSGNFPLTSAVLDGIYLVPTTGKFYICVEKYDGKSIDEPNNNFEELSVYKIREKINYLQDSFYLKKYGVKFTGSNPAGKRTHDAVGMVANVGVDSEVVVNDFDSVPFYNRPVCCGTHDENGNFIINAYEGEPGFTRDGSNGDVYYECTPFYWNGSFEEPVVSAVEFEGSKLAPMFDSPDKKVYLPCYWASLTSEGKYRSISGQYPEWSSLNGHMEKCRKTNTNAHTETIKAHTSEYILQLVEFATKDLQTVMMGVCNMVWEHTDKVATQETTNQNYIVIAKDKASSYVIGQTITNSSNWNGCRRTVTRIEEQSDTNAYLYFDNQEPLSVKAGVKISSFPYKTGATDNIKASSGSAVSNTDGKHQCKWRGKESPWSEGFSGLCDIIRKIEEDGNHYPYLLKVPKKYNNGTLTGDYVKLDYTVPKESGYAKTLGVNPKYPFAAITNEIGASSNTYLSAYYYTNTNPLTVAFVGGHWGDGRACSPVGFYLLCTPSYSGVDRLARLFVTPV